MSTKIHGGEPLAGNYQPGEELKAEFKALQQSSGDRDQGDDDIGMKVFVELTDFAATAERTQLHDRAQTRGRRRRRRRHQRV